MAANAGLLEGHRATGHWYSLPSLQKFSGTTWIRDQRYVSDGVVVTTTGVTASIPASHALGEAIAGHNRATQEANGPACGPYWPQAWAGPSEAFRNFAEPAHREPGHARRLLCFVCNEPEVGLRFSMDLSRDLPVCASGGRWGRWSVAPGPILFIADRTPPALENSW